MRDLADLGRNVKRIGAWRVVSGLAPAAVRFDRFAADKLQRLGRRLVPQGLTLQMAGDRKDFQSALLSGGHALFGVFLGADVIAAAIERQFPTGLFPAVETRGR